MPSMNGIDIISNLSLDTEEKKICNIIVISGENSLRYNLFNTSKIFRVMPKPVEFDDILSTIKEIPLALIINFLTFSLSFTPLSFLQPLLTSTP